MKKSMDIYRPIKPSKSINLAMGFNIFAGFLNLATSVSQFLSHRFNSGFISLGIAIFILLVIVPWLRSSRAKHYRLMANLEESRRASIAEIRITKRRLIEKYGEGYWDQIKRNTGLNDPDD